MSIPHIILENRVKLKHKKDFERIFKLEFERFFNLVTGFDICLFDEVLNPPENMSLENFVLEKYGEEGRHLILELL